MAKKYCKKSSMQAVADEIRVRGGIASSNKLTTSQMKTTIDNLVIPVQQSTSYITLDANTSSYPIPRGVHSGNGTVTVNPQAKTATLTPNGNTVQPNNGYVLSSVTVPAKNTFTIKSKIVTPGNGATSITVDSLSFQPKGLVAVCTHSSSVMTDNYVTALFCSNSVNGYFSTKSGYYGRVTSATVTTTSTSITVSNIVGTRNNAAINGRFRNVEYSCMVWG